MLKIGITGGIGSGKSIICRIFSLLGVPVFNSDVEAKNLLSSYEVKLFYKKEFGNSIFINDEIDKKKLAAIIFNNPEALEKVNHFIHPLVGQLFENWCMNYNEQPYVIKEAALLIESEIYQTLDYTILVTAPEILRVRRVVSRDKMEEDKVWERIKNQLTDEEKIKKTDFTIRNDGTELIVPQIISLHQKFIGITK